VAELALVKLANRLIETFQKNEASGSDAGLDDASVIGLAGARDEAALFHAVEETGHVRVVGDHTFADAAAGEAGRFGAAKNAEDVVLGASEAMRLEELLGFQAEVVGSFLEGDEDTGFDGESGMRRGAATHGVTIVVMTTSVKRKEWEGDGRPAAGSEPAAKSTALNVRE
jgi:hypothetical protein